MQNLSDWLLYSAYEGVKVKVADEASTPLMLNSGTIYFSYNIHAVTCVVTWSVCDAGRVDRLVPLVRQTVEM